MAHLHGASNTQKTLLIALADGWLLRFMDRYGWCLFQPGRNRPFATVKKRTVEEMTNMGWLTPGTTPKGLGFRPAKDLTPSGRQYAAQLSNNAWGVDNEWAPPLPMHVRDEEEDVNEATGWWFRRAA